MLNLIRTKSRLRDLIIITEELLQNSYLVGNTHSAAKADVIKKYEPYIKDFNLDLNSKNDLSHFLATLTKLRDADTYIRVLVAFETDPSFEDVMYSKFQEVIKSEFLLDIQVDASILGGLVVTYAGRVSDLSLKSQLENYFKDNTQHV